MITPFLVIRVLDKSVVKSTYKRAQVARAESSKEPIVILFTTVFVLSLIHSLATDS